MSHETQWMLSTQLKSDFAKIDGRCSSEGGSKAFFAYHMVK